ncbi:zinc-binding dehydrogenase [Microdochium trichocladiopsis]|uniref:Zinc-binding dehydrogenase n=1 Tax=Microdochium trichocladiopsis TaxID=1682393 RepID=A0A9P9BJC2_9PEZI|nr:zinc-binding dehydrogenase [Microdochium trichocladiopsis]KAH7014491.1 zinc-binding dehydrogenase [Microdochium trichocladiopsis]
MSMKALVTTGEKTAVVKTDVPIPKPRPGEILVKVHYAAQNPTDWKGMVGAKAGKVLGCDFAGTVADANGTSMWPVGQRVAGWVHGNTVDPPRGAFAEYLTTEPSLVFPVPDNVSLEAASTVSLAVATAVQALFQRLQLPQPGSSSSSSSDNKNKIPVLIYGGTSSVGLYAVQLARMAGLYVIATGSAKNHSLLKSLGADETVDYNDSNWVETVRSLTNDNLQHALDTISEGGTIEKVASAMSTTKGGHVVCLLPVKSAKANLEGTDVGRRVKIESTIAYSVFEKPLEGYGSFDNQGGVTTEDRRFWEGQLKHLPEWLGSGKLKTNKVTILGGLEAIPEGFRMHSEGKVRVEKLVYKIA